MWLVVLDNAVLQREERPIATDANILAGVQFAPALTDDDRTGENGLAAETFYAQPLRLTGPTVAR